MTSSPEFSFRTRREWLERADGATYDALIVGGGIVGAGLARELSIRGLKTLLVEQGDFASGTSSRSSKLIHGGLRYLEMFDFGLVFEALAERHWLLRTHPHLVSPLEFDLPVYDKANAPPGARSGFLLKMGLWLYDGLSLFRTPFMHGRHSLEETKRLFPGIREEGLRASLYYADALMHDDEMVLECLHDSVRRGSTALNYVRAEEVSARGADGLFEAALCDRLPLAGEPAGSPKVRAREVISCVGPWTELFGDRVPAGAGRKLKPSKGVHLILPWKRLPIQKCIVMYARDGRIVFAIPRKDLGPGAEKIIVGTTDSPSTGDPGEARAANGDLDYLLSVLTKYFPKAALSRDDVIMTYAGVRPLLDEGVAAEAKTSREHQIWRNPAGIVFMAGGKYTTFRNISVELADFAFPRTRASGRVSKEPLSTPAEYAARLTGTPLWGRYTDGWLRWKIRHHCPCTLEDLVWRRIPLWMEGAALPPAVLDSVMAIAQEEFHLTGAQLAEQREALDRSIRVNLPS